MRLNACKNVFWILIQTLQLHLPCLSVARSLQLINRIQGPNSFATFSLGWNVVSKKIQLVGIKSFLIQLIDRRLIFTFIRFFVLLFVIFGCFYPSQNSNVSCFGPDTSHINYMPTRKKCEQIIFFYYDYYFSTNIHGR